MKSKLLCASLTVAFCAASAPVAGESLTQDRLAFIKASFDRSLNDPGADPDRLAPTTIALIHSAYATHQPSSRVDDLTHDRRQIMLSAYQTHNPSIDSFVLANDF